MLNKQSAQTCSKLNHKNARGFTLLEVLIALMVLATGLMALSGSMTEITRTQVSVKDRTFASMVAKYRLAELRLDNAWPSEGVTRGDIQMLNKSWTWKQEVIKTTEPDLKRVEVSIAITDNDPDYFISKIVAFLPKPDKENR